MADDQQIPPLPPGYQLTSAVIPPLPVGYKLTSAGSSTQTLDPNQPGMQPLSMMDRFKNAVSSPANYVASVKANAEQIPKFVSALGQDAKQMVNSPGAVAQTVAGPAFNMGEIKRLYDMARGKDQPEPEFLDRVGGSLGINTQGVRDSASRGDLAGVVGHAALPLGAIAGAHGAGAADALPNRPTVRGVLADRMAEVPPGERFSRQEVLDAARTKGVNLDLAQATDAPAAHSVKKATEYTLGGGGPFEANKTKNLSALEQWANSTADDLSPEATPRDVVGAQMQAALKSHLEARKGVATQQFKELDKTIGNNKVDASGIQEAAQQIVDQNKEYYAKHPELKPKQAWSVLEDLAGNPNKEMSNYLQKRGIPVNKDGTVTLYHATDAAAKINSEGVIKGTTGKSGGGMSVGDSAWFSADPSEVKNWDSGGTKQVVKVDVPAEYLRHMGGAYSKEFYFEGGLKRATDGTWGPEQAPRDTFVNNTAKREAQPSWSELHQLRSDLMDFYRNNPDVVKGRSDAWIQQMVSKIDQTMTSSSANLSPQDLSKFRQANATWESIKSTYDNPASPYYQAVRTQYPSNLPANLASRPEVARQVRQTLSSLEDGSTAEGAFQRQFVENLINDKSGKLDLKNLNSKLSRTPDDVLRAMVGDDGAKNLRILGKVAQKVTADSNPSGTAKNVVRTTEVVNALHNPIAGAAEIGGTYAAGKAINSPSVIDFLTKPRANR